MHVQLVFLEYIYRSKIQHPRLVYFFGTRNKYQVTLFLCVCIWTYGPRISPCHCPWTLQTIVRDWDVLRISQLESLGIILYRSPSYIAIPLHSVMNTWTNIGGPGLGFAFFWLSRLEEWLAHECRCTNGVSFVNFGLNGIYLVTHTSGRQFSSNE